VTADDLMALVNRYVEACDDLGDGLFEKPLSTTDALHAKATELHAQIKAEVTRLHAEAANAQRLRVEVGDIISNQCIAMQAAVIEGHLGTLDEGLQWIRNTLIGPGLYPDIEAAQAMGGAQAWFDAKMAEHEAFRKAHPAP